MTLYELYQAIQKFLTQIEFAQTHNENHSKREKIINNKMNHDEGYSIGHLEEHMKGYMDTTLIWKELFKAVNDFETSGTSNRPKVIDKLLVAKKAIICQCRPNGMVVPYCDIKEVSKGRYIQVEDEDARAKSVEAIKDSKIESSYCSVEKTAALLESLRSILRECEEEFGIERTKSDIYKDSFKKEFAESEVARATKNDISKMSNGKSSGNAGEKDEDKKTVTEIATLTGKSESYITQLCNDDSIINNGKGRKRRINEASALKYFAEAEQRKRERKIKNLGQAAIADAKDYQADKKRMDKLV